MCRIETREQNKSSKTQETKSLRRRKVIPNSKTGQKTQRVLLLLYSTMAESAGKEEGCKSETRQELAQKEEMEGFELLNIFISFNAQYIHMMRE